MYRNKVATLHLKFPGNLSNQPEPPLIYDLASVQHSVGEYVRGMAHTNGIESFWATLKRAHKGVYHKMSRKHLHRYVADFSGRHGLRELDTLEQMGLVACAMVGKRLRYRTLVA